ncbi:MAG TPA: Na+/H+ antiporter NhaA [Pyrinomonadaceae bacterium]|nr:Na+/H+ antiporter NhaA [Pyrinomonadaceae bacterium]
MRQDRIDIWLRPVNRFIKNETAGGIVLFAAAVLALIAANSPLQHYYHQLWQYPFGFNFAGFEISKSLHHWINDGLMSVFFFVVGLELKREIIGGELSDLRKATLPLAAGFGGMFFPAVIYVLFNRGTDGISGWGIPMATDIAFALGILFLLGSRVPVSLKVFLTALAIADDIGAVLVIAFFYTSEISLFSLGLGSVFLAVLIGGNLLGIRTPIFYGIIGIGGLWLAFLLSGVHATIAGILAALTIPATVKVDSESFLSNLRSLADRFGEESPGKKNLISYEQLHIIDSIKRYTNAVDTPLQRLEHGMHSLVAFIVLPVFAFANAGITITSDLFAQVASTVTMGVLFGLTFGKTIGIVLMSKLAVYLNLASLPAGTSWKQIYAVAFLASIGFTMSIFITELAFVDAQLILQAKLGIFIASAIGGVVGYLLLRMSLPDGPRPAHKETVEIE